MRINALSRIFRCLRSLQGAPLSRAPLVVLVVIAAVAVFFILTWTPRFIAGNSSEREFIVERGQSLGTTARKLAERGLVVNRVLFVFYSILTGHEKDFKAGRYILPERASIRDLVKVFAEGRSEPDDIVVTIPEGNNAADIDRIFTQSGLIRANDIIRMMFGPGQISHEGKLSPDTYRFQNKKVNVDTEEAQPQKLQEVEPLDSHAEEIIRKMRENFERRTEKLFKNLEILKIRETIIIASMLEKEVQTEEDMRLVAGIIKKRLELGMPLQVDATVAYGVCYPEFFAGRYCDVSQANIVDNLKIDSEYNTYVRKELPIGPISNPGLKAIKAALNPEPSDYLYYLSARDGTTIFSKTAVEHERNRAKYLRRNPNL